DADHEVAARVFPERVPAGLLILVVVALPALAEAARELEGRAAWVDPKRVARYGDRADLKLAPLGDVTLDRHQAIDVPQPRGEQVVGAIGGCEGQHISNLAEEEGCQTGRTRIVGCLLPR